ncbi:MAG: lamin tail domain-containing protein [Candidatus Dojkabacteria bacterium]|nr:lamin tail domain-containing protein [Candidatus Dojkabacteria bacterium]MDQ7021780.1 lamin tail domain-containing protein [Candidatus Dojkabacteria bacterium]
MKKRILLCLFTFFIFSHKLNAQSTEINDKVFINEFLPNPVGTDAGLEWIELYNVSDNTINLNNWKIETVSDSGSVRTTIIIEGEIGSNEFIIITEDATDYKFTNYIDVGAGGLNMYNSGSIIRLINENDEIIDYLEYSNAVSGKSFERKGPIDSIECNELLVHPDSNSLNIENLNKDETCWDGEIITQPEVKIEFSTDEINWNESLDSYGETELFFRYITDPLVNDYKFEKWLLDVNSEISSPIIIDNYIGRKIKLNLIDNDDQIVEFESSEVHIYDDKLQFSEVFQVQIQNKVEESG